MTRRLAAAVVLGALGVVAVGCGLFGTDLGVTGVDVSWVSIDGQNGRTALVVTPEDHDVTDATAKLPVVVVLHGLGDNAEDMARLAEWPTAARDVGFIAVFPQGEEDSWNAGGCCGVASETDVNDVGFLDFVIDQMVAEEGGDPERIYMSGYSNGAMMTYRYLCERPDRLQGAASVAGTDFDPDCTPTAAVPFLQVSGLRDPVIPVEGGESGIPSLGDIPDVEDSVELVARGADCGPPTTAELGGVKVQQWAPCRDGAVVRYDVVDGLDHAYPAGWVSPDYVGVDQILRFWGLVPAT